MRKSQLVIVLAAVVIPLAVYFLFSPHSETQEEYTARMFEKHTGIPRSCLIELMHANQDLRDRKATEADIEVLEKYSSSPHIELRATSEVFMGFLVGTRFQPRAHTVLLRLAEDPDPGTRTIAIRCLIPFSRPEAKAFVEKNRVSSNPYVVSETKDIAKKLQ